MWGHRNSARRSMLADVLPDVRPNPVPVPDEGLLQQVLLAVRAVQASQVRMENQIAKISLRRGDGDDTEAESHHGIESPGTSHTSTWLHQGRSNMRRQMTRVHARGIENGQGLDDQQSSGFNSALPDSPGGPGIRHKDAALAVAAQAMNKQWPCTVGIRPELHDQEAREEEDLAQVISRLGVQNNVYKPMRSGSHTLLQARGDGGAWAKTCGKVPVFNPDHPAAVAIELLAVVVLQYDLVVAPFLIAWGIEVEGALLWVQVFAGLFWFMLILVDFNTAIYTRGDVIADQPRLAKYYLRNRFPVDFMLFSIDWFNIIIDAMRSSLGMNKSGWLYNLGKIGRLLKVIRLIRLARVLDHVFTRRESEHLRFVVMCLKITFVTLLVTHVLSCVWFWIGRDAHSDTGYHWLNLPAAVDMSDEIGDSSSEYQYLTSFHWTIGQLTLGGAEGLMPMSSVERTFSIGLLLMGLIFCSTIMSFFSAQIIQLVMTKQEQNHQLLELRKYLRHHGVSPSTHLRVIGQVVNRFDQENPLREEDVVALHMLAPTLRIQLLHETRVPHLLKHPFFQIWGEVDITAVHALSHDAVNHRYLVPEDDLFIAETDAHEAFHVVKGRLAYTQVPSSSKVRVETMTTVLPGAWLCEAALWSYWVHVGSMVAERHCHILTLATEPLFKTIEDHVTIRTMTNMYGKNFHARIISALPPHSPHPSDLSIPFTEDVASLLSQHVGIGLLKRALNNGMLTLSAEDESYLVSELKGDRCTVQYTADGSQLERVVAVTNIALSQPDGTILYQIGMHDPGKGVKASCHIPGCKRKGAETPGLALERLLKDDFGVFAERLCIDSNETIVSIKEQTQNLKMRTKTAKTVYKASLTVSVEELMLPVAGLTKVPEVPELGDMTERQVLVLPLPNNKSGLYAFFQSDEYAIVDDDANLPYVQKWLDCLDVEGKTGIIQA